MLVTEGSFDTVMDHLLLAEEVAVDTETSGLDVRNKRDWMMGVCLSVESLDCYMPFRHPSNNLSDRHLKYLHEKILIPKPLIWHSRKFDMHSFATAGINPLEWKGLQYDVQILFHLWNEELYSTQLDSLAKQFIGEGKVGAKEFHDAGKYFGYKNIPAAIAAPYGAADARITRLLKRYIWPKYTENEDQSVYWDTEVPFMDLLFKLEQRAVGANIPFAEERNDTGLKRMSTIRRELGYNPASPTDLKKFLLQDLDLPVLAHTKSCGPCSEGFPVHSHEGPASFNKNVMEDYDDILQASSNPTARRISEYRGWQKATSSLYQPVLERSTPDGRIRTDFRQGKTVTGRLSAAEPNLQQVPRGSSKPWNGNAKLTFNSGIPGYLLYGWDYAQLELRLAAAYGNESVLLTEFNQTERKADPFGVLAKVIFGIYTPETKHDTKTFVYANLYGAGLRKIAAQLGRSEESTKPLFENYKNSIPGIQAVSHQVARLVEQRGYVKYWDGRTRHIRNRSDSYKAWNSVCQGGGAQLVKKAMLRCRDFESEDCYMVLQVHDEITFIIREDKLPYYEPLIVEAMTNWDHLPVPFGVNFTVEGKEWK